MSCELHSESGNSNNLGRLTTPIRTTNLSRRFSSSNQLSGLLATSRSKDSRLNADYNVDTDHAKITMKTRVAVRDKLPHRFQVVPLRDVSGLALLDGGRPSQLTLPPASHTLLRSASIRRHSQVRPVIASTYSELDITQNKCDMMMLADSETLATPSAGIPVLALSPSFELGSDNPARSHALAEQDMNRQDTTTTTNKYEGSVTTPTKAPQSYDASHQTYYVQNPTIQSSLMESPRKKRTRSENMPRIRDNNRRDGPAATKENSDFRMSKRHAIYTQSLYVPFLESPSYFPGSSTEGHHQLFNENVSDSHLADEASFNEMSRAIVSESGTTLSNGRISPIIGLVLASEAPLPMLVLNSPGSATNRGLNYHRLSRVYPLSAEARLDIIYPQIVREMFGDIDRAIQEWKQN